MSNESDRMDDKQLDEALDRLRAPLPSDTLVARLRTMAPVPVVPRKFFLLTPRGAAAAMLAVSIAAATLLQVASTPPAQPVAAIADPAGEIPVSDLAVADENPAAPTEPFSLAGLPLE